MVHLRLYFHYILIIIFFILKLVFSIIIKMNSFNRAAQFPLMTFDDSDDQSELNNIDFTL